MDTVYSIYVKRDLVQDHIDSEIQRWLELLLQLVDITGPNPEEHLRQFIYSKEAVLRKYRHISQKYVSVHLVMVTPTTSNFVEAEEDTLFSYRLYKPPRSSSPTSAFSSSSNSTSLSASGLIR